MMMMMMHLQMVIWDTAVPHTEARAAPTHAWVRPSSSRRALNRAAKVSRSSLNPAAVSETVGNIASATVDCSLVICFVQIVCLRKSIIGDGCIFYLILLHRSVNYHRPSALHCDQ